MRSGESSVVARPAGVPPPPGGRWLMIALLLLLLGLPLLLVTIEVLESAAMHRERRIERTVALMRECLARVQRASSTPRVWRDDLRRLHQRYWHLNPGRSGVVDPAAFARGLAVARARLPKCDLAFGILAADGQVATWSMSLAGLGLQQVDLAAMMRVLRMGRATNSWAHDPRSAPAQAARRVGQQTRRIFGVPVSIETSSDRVNGHLQLVNHAGRLRGVFWSYFEEPQTRIGTAMVAWLDIGHPDPLAGPRRLVASVGRRGWGIGFHGMAGGRRLAGGALRDPGLFERARAAVAPATGRQIAVIEHGGRFWVIGGAPAMTGIRCRVLLGAPVTEAASDRASGALWWLVVGPVVLGALVGLRAAWFGDGLRPTVALTMLGAIMALTLLPVCGARILLGRWLAATRAVERRAHHTAADEDISAFDANLAVLESCFQQSVRDSVKHPGLAAQLAGQPAPPAAEVTRTVRQIASGARLIRPVRQPHPVDLVLARGVNGVEVAWSRFQDHGVGRPGGGAEALRMMGPMMSRLLERARAGISQPIRPGATGAGDARQDAVQAMTADLAMMLARATMGDDALVALMHRSEVATEVRSNFLCFYLMFGFVRQPPAAPRGKVVGTTGGPASGGESAAPPGPAGPDRQPARRGRRVGVHGWLWSDWLYTHVFNQYLRLFALPGRPGTLAVYMVVDSIRQGWGHEIAALRAVVHDLVERADGSGLPQTFEFAPGGRATLVLARPGRYLNRFVLARVVPGFDADAAAARHQRRTRWLIMLGLLAAAALAWCAHLELMAPLRTVLAALERVRGGHYTVRLEPGRADEFGAMALAFNQMAAGLEEGRVLGSYVSSSVREVVSDSHRRRAAERGERREVTMLFSVLRGIERLAAADAPEVAFAALGLHLDRVSEACRQHGGEIDKVIGEKVLVVFPHRSLGGPDAAARAAVAVAAAIQHDWAALAGPGGFSELNPVFGISSGVVVAGLLGAASVRLDYTVIGDPVNLAARLAALAEAGVAPPGHAVVAGAVIAALAGPVADRDEYRSGVSIAPGVAGSVGPSGGPPGTAAHRAARAWRLPVRQVKGKLREVEAFALPLT